MRVIGLLLAFVFAFQSTCWIPAYAATATFGTDASGAGNTHAQIPVNKIGALLLADATAFLNSSVIEVRSQSTNNGTNTLLNGTVLNAQVIGTGANRVIHGLAFFQGGSSIGSLCKKGSRPERVRTSNGDIISGVISNVTADGLDVGGRRVPASMTQCIDSPCAFEFEIPLSGVSGVNNVSGEAKNMSFSQCTIAATPVVKEKREKVEKVKTASEHSTRTKVIVGVLVLAAIATAIAVPIAVTHHRHRHRNNDNTAQLLLQQQLLRQRQSAVSNQLTSTLINPFSNSNAR